MQRLKQVLIGAVTATVLVSSIPMQSVYAGEASLSAVQETTEEEEFLTASSDVSSAAENICDVYGIDEETYAYLKDSYLNGLDSLEDDPGYLKILENGIASLNSISTASFSYNGYSHNDKFSESTIRDGIDVSYYQGDIDWAAVKNSGIDFVFIRVGYRGSSNGALHTDTKALEYLSGAISAGLEVGVYFFSQAVTTAEAVEEANYALSIISGYNVTLPVVIDYEYVSGGRLENASLSDSTRTSIVNSFCSTVQNAGYVGMVYANMSMLQDDLNASDIPYKVWLANYVSETSYAGDYEYWQYSSSGSVSGISGNVDRDFWYCTYSTYNGVDYSSVYNYSYYINRYSDLKAVYGNDPTGALQHFITYGMSEGRQAISTFNVTSYRYAYQDLRLAYGTDLKSYYIHYIYYGKKEGRTATGTTTLKNPVTSYGGVNYSSVYDYEYYINKYSDIKKAYGDDDVAVLQHFIIYGMKEGRQAISTFNVTSYRYAYQDLRLAYGMDLKSYYIHYINYGKKEGRTATGTTTLKNPVTSYGGVNYSAVYDYEYYISKYSDIKKVYGDNDVAVLQHFITFGMKEGRRASSAFNVSIYRSNYADLQKAFGSNLTSYYIHYINYGKSEGRNAVTKL